MHQQMLIASSVTFPAQATWDPSFTAANITLSNGNLDAEGNANNAGISVSTGPKSSGKYFFEVQLMAVATTGNLAFCMGVSSSTGGLTNFLGQTADGFSTWCDNTGSTQRSTYNNNSRTNVITGAGAPTIGMRARAVVMPGVGIWLGRWGTTVWNGGGDPVAETSPTYVLPAGNYRMAVNPRGVGCRLRLVDPSNWANPVPGCSVWTP